MDDGEYFDRLLTAHGEFNPFTDQGWSTLADCVRRTVTASSALDVLDVGCGTGESYQLFADVCARYVGVDLSHEALRRARTKFPQRLWLRGDATALPFHRDSFSLVAFSSVLHHIPDPVQALAQAYAVLRPGGQVFAFDPNLFHPAMALFRHPKSPCYLSQGVSPNERPLRPSYLRAAVLAAGFVEINQYCQSDIGYRAVAPRLINACLSAYNVADRLLQRSGLARWFGTFVVTAARKPS